MTIELTDLDARAIRAFIVWLTQLEADGTLEMYEYQRNTLNKLARSVEA